MLAAFWTLVFFCIPKNGYGLPHRVVTLWARRAEQVFVAQKLLSGQKLENIDCHLGQGRAHSATLVFMAYLTFVP